jgi:hypothetical protein
VNTPEAEAAIAARKARLRQIWDGDRPLYDSDPARHYRLADAGPGWELYSTTRRFDIDSSPLGGICLEIVTLGRVDDETGEVADGTGYRCLASWQPWPWLTLAADEIDEALLRGVDRRRAWQAVQWLVRQIDQQRLAPSGHDIRHAADAARVAARLA